MAAASLAPSLLTGSVGWGQSSPDGPPRARRCNGPDQRGATIDPDAPQGDGRGMLRHYNSFAGNDVGRIEALSDGIFAFAATVLVLDFRSPEPADIHSEAELMSALLASSHRLMPWLLSLLTLGIFWVAQQTELSHLARSNRDLTWLHLAFLALITVLPFTTRLLADFFTYRVAFLIYWFNIFILGAAVYTTSTYAVRAKLIRDDAPPELLTGFRRRIFIAQSLYAAGALVGLLNVPLGIALIILVQLNYAVAPRLPILSRL
jgi:uncharacterized membrane protein